jgi:antagonist of KipI
VQDLGRPRWRSDGIPPGGAVDALSHRLANFLVGNEATAASIEIAGGVFSAITERAGWLAAACEVGQFLIDQQVADVWRPLYVPAGARIEIRPGWQRNYVYLTTAGGWDVPMVLGSRSTCLSAGFGGLEGRGLRPGDVLNTTALPDWPVPPGQAGVAWSSRCFIGAPDFRKPEGRIRVLPGPEAHWWSASRRAQFFLTPFGVSIRRDRMGVRLEGEACAPDLGEPAAMLSEAVGPGVVQVPPDGQPFVLLADAQTTGGYPRIAQVVAVDVPRLAQIPTGQTIHFQEITLDEAERLFFDQEKMLQKTQLALRWALNGPAT